MEDGGSLTLGGFLQEGVSKLRYRGEEDEMSTDICTSYKSHVDKSSLDDGNQPLPMITEDKPSFQDDDEQALKPKDDSNVNRCGPFLPVSSTIYSSLKDVLNQPGNSSIPRISKIDLCNIPSQSSSGPTQKDHKTNNPELSKTSRPNYGPQKPDIPKKPGKKSIRRQQQNSNSRSERIGINEFALRGVLYTCKSPIQTSRSEENQSTFQRVEGIPQIRHPYVKPPVPPRPSLSKRSKTIAEKPRSSTPVPETVSS